MSYPTAVTISDVVHPNQIVIPSFSQRMHRSLDALYPADVAARTCQRLVELIDEFAADCQEIPPRTELFDETDVVLITYADQIREPGRAPLTTLHKFLRRHVQGVISGVHLLPFYPASSDGGFSVIDYSLVDPAVGRWEDVTAIGSDFRLMVDAVVNHISAHSPWFCQWLAGDPARHDFFIAVDPATDLSMVTRPRALPLLTPFETANGPRYVWTTFSADQVDLNYANPEVLLAITRVLLQFVTHGAGIIRLDAIAYLWKQLATCCIHLNQTHEVLRLWRTIIDAVAPDTLLITETNVPHAENVSYFGDGTNEAHLVYQFALPPLVLSSFQRGDASTLREWAASLETPSSTTTFFNFLSSHDGIGVRPVEEILPRDEIDTLCTLGAAHGGGVSYRAMPDGSVSPYEINTVYFDALAKADGDEPQDAQVDRFITAQSILLALAGVPAIYVHSLLGSRNWTEGPAHTGELRAINRQTLDRATLEADLADPASLRHQVFTRLLDRIRVRTSELAFHPNGPQTIIGGNPALFTIERTAPDGTSRVLCVHNVTNQPQRLTAGPEEGVRVRGVLEDLCSSVKVEVSLDGHVEVDVPPYGVRWLHQC